MTEIEVKILDIDPAAIEAKLVALGARKEFEGDIMATLYDFPDERLRREKKLLRVRTKGDEVEFTLKKSLPDPIAKAKEELEVTVSDIATMQRILAEIGLVETVSGHGKRRISYELDGDHYEIDRFDDIPPFLEIEVHESSRTLLCLEKLGIALEDAKPWSIRDVYEHYGVPY